jgi:hypothetical protein
MGKSYFTTGGLGRFTCGRSTRVALLGATALLLSGAGTIARAQVRTPPVLVTQFDMTGFLQAATLDPPGDILAGGTLLVNGQLVIVPRNTEVVFPAAFITWQQVFQLAPPPYGPTQTGLAMSDTPPPFVPYEVHVIGNRVVTPGGGSDRYIAGLVFIAQQSLNAGAGYINFIDYTTGEFRVGGIIGDPTTGQRVLINDPIGRFGRASSPDTRFTIDEENPNIRSETGYPFCMPRVDPAVADDPLCPQKNRPIDATTGTFAQIFTMPAVPDCTSATAGPDPCLMAPLEVGDFVTYSGTLMKDGPQPSAGPNPAITVGGAPPAVTLNTSYISAWSVTANVGIFTTPGTNPVYVATDVALLGTGGTTVAGAAEATVRTRFEGFTTDPFHFPFADPACQDPAFAKAAGVRCSIVDLYGIDVNACTGDASERPWGAIDVDQGPPTGAVPGRWRFRPPSKTVPLTGASGIFDPPPQQMRAKLRGAQVVLTKNGLFAGQYTAPIGEYLFPENAGTGKPVVPNNFESFPFLAQGLGPLDGPGGSGPIVGQLSPWPGAIAPTKATSCAPATLTSPTARASAPAGPFVSGMVVTLDGSASTDPNGLPLIFAWTQTAGPTVALAAVDKPSFIAPAVSSATVLTFSLTVSDTGGQVSPTPAVVSVTVNPPAATTLPPIADAGANQTVAAGAVVHLNGTASSDPNIPAQALTFNWTAPAGITLANAATASPTFTAPAAAASSTLTFTLTVTNSPGGLTSAPATVTITVNPVAVPVAIVGPSQTVLQGSSVTLDGTASFDPNGLPLTYSWLQTAGTAVTLTGATTATPTFTAPPGTVTLAFSLVVNNGFSSSIAAGMTVTVLATADVIAITTAEYRIGKQRLTVSATSSVATAQLFLLDPTVTPAPTSCVGTPTPVGCIPMTIQAGVPTVILVGVAQPSSVTVLSNLGGSATSGLTRLR